jgi:hypothetical protein
MQNKFYIREFLNIFKKKKKIYRHVLRNNDDEKYFFIKTHKNNTSLIYFPKKNFFRKYSETKKGLNKIEAEINGFKWYCDKNNINLKYIIREFYKNNFFAHIDINEIKGIKAKSWNSIEKNFSSLKRVVKHYIKFYPKINKSKIHGDLTLDNIIFKEKGVFIIDWEFFNSKKNFRGYDIVYLILSAACLPYIFNKTFSKKDETLFKYLWKILIKQKFNKNMLTDPFNFFEKNIKSDIVLKSSLKLSKQKFFPFITSLSHKKKILNILKTIDVK